MSEIVNQRKVIPYINTDPSLRVQAIGMSMSYEYDWTSDFNGRGVLVNVCVNGALVATEIPFKKSCHVGKKGIVVDGTMVPATSLKMGDRITIEYLYAAQCLIQNNFF